MLLPRDVEVPVLQKPQGGPRVAGWNSTDQSPYGACGLGTPATRSQRFRGTHLGLGTGLLDVIAQRLKLFGDDDVAKLLSASGCDRSQSRTSSSRSSSERSEPMFRCAIEARLDTKKFGPLSERHNSSVYGFRPCGLSDWDRLIGIVSRRGHRQHLSGRRANVLVPGSSGSRSAAQTYRRSPGRSPSG
jgi:hypothetical protein